MISSLCKLSNSINIRNEIRPEAQGRIFHIPKFCIDKPRLFSYTNMYTTLYIGIRKDETLYFVFSRCLMEERHSMEERHYGNCQQV